MRFLHPISSTLLGKPFIKSELVLRSRFSSFIPAIPNGYKYISPKLIQEQKKKFDFPNLKQEMFDVQFNKNFELKKGVNSIQTQLGIISNNNSISLFCSGAENVRDVSMTDFFNNKSSLLKLSSFLFSEITSLEAFSSQRVFRGSAVIIKYSHPFYIPAHRDTQYSVSCICPIYSKSLDATLKVFHELSPAFGQWEAVKGDHIVDLKDGGLSFFDNRYNVLHELNLSSVSNSSDQVRYILVLGLKPMQLSVEDENEFIESAHVNNEFYYKKSFSNVGVLNIA